MSTLSITLPWPSPAVSPNARVFWMQKRSATKKMRETARMLTASEIRHRKILSLGDIKASGYQIIAIVGDKRRRDRDNISASCKAYLDGIAEALQQDDSEWEHHGVKIETVSGAEKRIIVRLTLQNSEPRRHQDTKEDLEVAA